jgi:hypothetical protein
MQLNTPIISAAWQHRYTLDVVSQITGIPPRLILATIKPVDTQDHAELYALAEVCAFFSLEAGARLIRKLRQNQLCIYRNCTVHWKDLDGISKTSTGVFVEIRGHRAEVTLSDGHRFIRKLDDPHFTFDGIRV